MGASELIGKELVKLMSSAIYVAAAIFQFLILGVWAVVVLNLAGITNWPKPLSASSALTVFGISIALLCAMMWFLNRIGILKLSDATEKNIWRVLILAVLGSVVSGVAAALQH